MVVLIVDDDEITLDMLEMTLDSGGHRVIRAKNVPEAIQVMDHERVNLVVTDWMMPGMSGPDFVKHIRARRDSRYIYTIMLTARNESMDIVEGLDSGADDFIVKPFNPLELAMRVKGAERIISLETRHVAIFALAKLTDSRDEETGLHLERIREYSRVIAEHIMSISEMEGRLSPDYAEMIYLTSPLHDIGKMGIPDCVLLKPSRLDDEEFMVMKTHATLGADTLYAAAEQFPEVEYLRMACNIARHHHERYDGKGYPDGLSGMDIPLSARIVAVADVYDALVSRRIYKQSFSHEIARSMIIEGTGTQFDPMVVEAFLAHEKEIVEIWERMNENSSSADRHAA